MPKLNVLNINGQNVGEIELVDSIFNVEVNEHVLYEVLNLLRLEQKLEVAEESLGNKKELVELDKVL